MATARRRGILAIATALVLVLVSVGVGVLVGDALGIRTEPSTQMTPADPVVPAVATAVAPPEFTTIDVPEGARYDVAVAELRDAVADAPSRAGEATLTVTPPASTEDAAADGYRLSGDTASLVVDAAEEAGAVRAIYDLAAAIRAGRAVTDVVGEAAASALSFRMADLGAVGVDPDPAQWVDGTDYSHVSRAFEDVYLEDDPYIDQAELAEAYGDWEEFLGAILADGYNAVAWPGFVEFTTFAAVVPINLSSPW